jgi:hypothetical protein
MEQLFPEQADSVCQHLWDENYKLPCHCGMSGHFIISLFFISSDIANVLRVEILNVFLDFSDGSNILLVLSGYVLGCSSVSLFQPSPLQTSWCELDNLVETLVETDSGHNVLDIVTCCDMPVYCHI